MVPSFRWLIVRNGHVSFDIAFCHCVRYQLVLAGDNSLVTFRSELQRNCMNGAYLQRIVRRKGMLYRLGVGCSCVSEPDDERGLNWRTPKPQWTGLLLASLQLDGHPFVPFSSRAL